MNDTFDYDQLRAAIRLVRRSLDMDAVIDAAHLLATYTEASLDLVRRDRPPTP